MKGKYNSIRVLLSVLAALVLLFGVTGSLSAGANSAAKGPVGGGIRTGVHPATGMLNFIGADPSAPIAVAGAVGQGIGAQSRAGAILAAYAPQFGVANPREELSLKSEKAIDKRQILRYQQNYNGVPVLGGEVMLQMNDGGLISMNGEVSPSLNIGTEPSLSAGQARETALALVAKHYNLSAKQLSATEPALWIYDERLLIGSAVRPPHLVWRVEVSAPGLPVRELVLVNALSGRISLNFNQVDTMWSKGAVSGTAANTYSAPPASVQPAPPAILGTPVLQTYDSQGTDNTQYVLICNNNTRTCSTGEANQAHRFAYDTYKVYEPAPFSRDSIDGAGLFIKSNVNWDDGVSCPNAFWDGMQMIYCTGLAADDVVGHELTHGVTQYESNLFYFWESGAINESLSDIWGEYVDQTNFGYLDSTDGATYDWKIGEDATGIGVIRDMKNPPLYGQPDSMTSSRYYKGTGDNGGVHYNSGVNNKAAYLLVAGGTFNYKTVTALGWLKTATIYYEAQTNLLTSGSGYYDLYNILYQACVNKIGTAGIVSADCQEVRDATDATKMNLEPAAGFSPNVTSCPVNTSIYQNLFTEDFETGTDGWTFAGTKPANWTLWSASPWYSYFGPNAYDGVESLYADDDTGAFADYTLNDSWAMSPGISLPAGSKPYLTFSQWFGFEYGAYFYDGGILEYSTNGGGTWTNASTLFNAGQNYKGTISSSYGNPLGGKQGWVGDSHGYVDSRYNLSTLAGQTVNFRWRMGTDSSGAYWGWFLDHIQVNTCVGIPSVPALSYPASNALITNYRPTFNWTDSTGDLHHYNIQVDDNSDFSSRIIDDSTVGTASEYTPGFDLPSNAKLYWRVQSVNAAGGTSAWTAARYYRSAMLPPNTLTPGAVVPNPYEQLLTRRPTFDWDAVAGATSYTVEVSTATTFATKAINATATTDQYTHAADLAANTVFYWRVKANGANGPSAYSQVRTFRTANPPSVPGPASPINNALITTTLTPTLDWSNSTVPAGTTFSRYNVELSLNSAFSPIWASANVGTLPTDSFYATPALTPGTTYWWRVRSVNTGLDATGYTLDDEYSGWSAVRYFRVAYAKPVLSTPADLATGVPLKPTFTWNSTAGATSYTIQVSKNATFTLLVTNLSVATNSYTRTMNLAANTLYYWRVRVNGAYGPSAWSTVFTFTTTP